MTPLMRPDDAPQLERALALLEKTPQLLKTLLAELQEDTLGWKPSPKRWSIGEILAHLAELEQVYGQRVQRIVTEDVPALEAYDQNAAAAEGRYSRPDPEESLASFIERREGTLAFLSMLPPGAAARTGKHSEIGSFTLSEMLHELASHDLGHLRQIAELYRAREFHPHSGPFRKYSNPQP
ncbi:MAG: DinB family protein [Acidobacteriia bacterium]|nr:DinB family protein [Terriglobia bacterium]